MTTPPDRFKRTPAARVPLQSLAEMMHKAMGAQLPPHHVTFETSPEDAAAIVAIVDRGMALWATQGITLNRRMALMDLTLVHTSLHPLDLVKFLHAETADFAADFAGIGAHMDRKGCRLVGFVPKFARLKS